MTVSETDVAVEISDMNKWFGDFHVLKDINLKVMKGERIVIAGLLAQVNQRSSVASTVWKSINKGTSLLMALS